MTSIVIQRVITVPSIETRNQRISICCFSNPMFQLVCLFLFSHPYYAESIEWYLSNASIIRGFQNHFFDLFPLKKRYLPLWDRVELEGEYIRLM
jgi:hypothetical protein